MRRSREQSEMAEHENPLSFCFEKLHQKLKDTPFQPTIKVADLSEQAATLMMNDNWENLIVEEVETKSERGETESEGDGAKSENVKIRCKPTETKMQKKKLTLKWAIPESEIIDMPNLKQKRKRRQKQK